MKIGILTLPLHLNYGGILQAYALQTVLIARGHEVVLLDRGAWGKLPLYRKFFRSCKWFVKSIITCKRAISPSKKMQTVGRNIRPFIERNLNLYFTLKPEKLAEKMFDALVVGSDQVWRNRYSSNIAFYYLDFAKKWNIKRISYAASFGIDDWDYSEKDTEKCRKLLSNFAGISVREKSAVDLCKKHFGLKAEVVLDPTMLLDVKDYIALFQQEKTPIDGQLLCYILDADIKKESIKSAIVSKRNYVPYSINGEAGCNLLNKGNRLPSIEYWLKGFYHAEFVFTDSFHGCVFSILFNKPFLVYGNEGRGMTRFESLLSQFDLTDRLVSSVDEVMLKMEEDINWDAVNGKLHSLRMHSMKFLEINHI